MPLYPSLASEQGRIDALEVQAGLQALRYVIDGTYSPVAVVDGISDAFSDETGIDQAATTGAEYDGDLDLFSNPAPTGVSGIPAMTSNDAPSGTVSGVSNQTPVSNFWWVFDNNTASVIEIQTGGRIEYDFGPGGGIVPSGYSMRTHGEGLGRYPHGFNFEGWNGTGWDRLDTQTGLPWSYQETKHFTVSTDVAYERFAWEITQHGHNRAQISDIWLYDAASAPVMILTGAAQVAHLQPVTARIIALVEIGVAASVAVQATRDGGATWSDAVPPVYEAQYTGDIGLYSAEIPLGALGGGTSMQWRIIASGGVAKIHAVYFQWDREG